MAQSVLSRRAQDVVDAGSDNPMWDVMKDAWDASTNPNGYVNVGVAENTLMHDELLKFINKKLELPAKYLTYNDGGSGSSRLKAAIAAFLDRHLKPVKPLEPSHVIATNGVSSAVEHVAWSFADPGEGILLGRPYYGMFIPDISLRSRSPVVPVSFGEHDPLSIESVDKYEEALLEFHRTTVLVKLMRLCQKYQIHFVSDEIYALSVFENTVDKYPPPVKFESALSIDLTGIIDPRLVHVLWGMSKDFGANGIRLGVIISQANRDFHMAMTGPSLYSFASGITDHLTSLLLEDFDFTDRYIQQNQKLLSESYAYTANYLKDHGIEYATGCNAAFFVWMNLGKRYRELHPETECENVGEQVMQHLLQKKVFLASGFLFGSEKDGWFRLVFTQGHEFLTLALERIVAALEG
ncbi:1-aminocyclopropane-1-carboxylate synthase [Penicillium roqueforti FM164]|uniref:1-aminocyclopropane-1-carboxylate synthase n=1 Tax=Penicillium roqueforti (strain FM164) TaxID=1365484 RepID=W6QQU6_PENRF|nr:1-aminocyclopropane-1-carboxylate synthase [Penicillium roqueforti FM164]